jgi:NAD(P)-dependent dehydrogenase (short-subunit alcohol dehydrogenase family)
MPIIGMGAYCASKAAAKTAMAVAARELRREKIRVIDVRAPHSETGLVDRALEGAAPKMPEGLDPQFVVDRVLDAIVDGEKDLPAEAFSNPSR